MSDSEKPSRRRWISLGEFSALAALVISALGVWITWQSSQKDAPTRVVEQREAIPLTLRGRVRDDGRAMEISPVEDTHALQALTLSIPTSGSVIEIGSDGTLSSRAIESALNSVGDRDGKTHRIRVRIDARYVEAGADKRASGSYSLSYRWEGGGLFAGRSLRLAGLSKA
jgi:hypothetical protein